MSISHRDVRTVLAMIDGHTQGTAHYVDGDLSVTVRARQPGPDIHADLLAEPGRTVGAPAVGRLSITSCSNPVQPGTHVDEDTELAVIHSAGRETSVIAGTAGILQQFHAADGDFVEYGQHVASVAAGDTAGDTTGDTVR